LRRHRLTIEPVSVELGPVLERAVQSFRGRHAHPRVDFAAPAEKIHVMTDEPRLLPTLSALLEHVARVAPSAAVLAVEVAKRDGEAHLSFRAFAPHDNPEL